MAPGSPAPPVVPPPTGLFASCRFGRSRWLFLSCPPASLAIPQSSVPQPLVRPIASATATAPAIVGSTAKCFTRQCLTFQPALFRLPPPRGQPPASLGYFGQHFRVSCRWWPWPPAPRPSWPARCPASLCHMPKSAACSQPARRPLPWRLSKEAGLTNMPRAENVASPTGRQQQAAAAYASTGDGPDPADGRHALTEGQWLAASRTFVDAEAIATKQRHGCAGTAAAKRYAHMERLVAPDQTEPFPRGGQRFAAPVRDTVIAPVLQPIPLDTVLGAVSAESPIRPRRSNGTRTAVYVYSEAMPIQVSPSRFRVPQTMEAQGLLRLENRCRGRNQFGRQHDYQQRGCALSVVCVHHAGLGR